MKRTTIHTYAALALLLGLAACTQDEAGFLPEGAEGTPIVFTATGLNPAIETTGATAASRATVDGDWKGVQTVAVAIGGEVKAYDVTPTTADNTSATLTSTDPHYWTNHDNITVTAWWGSCRPKCPEELRGQRPHRGRGTDGELRQPHTPLHPPHGTGDRRSDGLH